MRNGRFEACAHEDSGDLLTILRERSRFFRDAAQSCGCYFGGRDKRDWRPLPQTRSSFLPVALAVPQRAHAVAVRRRGAVRDVPAVHAEEEVVGVGGLADRGAALHQAVDAAVFRRAPLLMLGEDAPVTVDAGRGNGRTPRDGHGLAPGEVRLVVRAVLDRVPVPLRTRVVVDEGALLPGRCRTTLLPRPDALLPFLAPGVARGSGAAVSIARAADARRVDVGGC